MRWTPGYRSRNVEDRRGQGGGMMRRGVPLGLGGLLIVFLLSLLTGQDLLSLLGGGGGMGTSVSVDPRAGGSASPASAEEQQRYDLVNEALDRVQAVWGQLLPGRYREAKLVVFNEPLPTTCGTAESSLGPFYCPGDEKAYIDLSFYDELERRFGAAGDFAQAYVLAHEIGHHVQNVLGIDRQVRALQQRRPDAANQLSVMMELQADCYAGVWAHYEAKQGGKLESGDLEEGLTAAAAIGDDRMMKMAGRRVNRESFTHGSSAERVEWLRRGMQSGDPQACDTFKALAGS
jgi:predicted metalloprotease